MQYVIITSLENFAALNNGKPDTGRMSIGSYFHMIGPAHLIANDPGLIKITIFLIKIKKSDFFYLNRIFSI